MYTYPNLSSILSSLSSLTIAELKVLQDNIDSIITKIDPINNKKNIEVNYMSDTCLGYLQRNSKVYASVHETVPSQENLGFIYRSCLNSVPTDNLDLFIEKLKNASLLQLEQLKNTSNQKSSSAPKPDRPLGVWKGKVRMSDDFNESSSDILSEFGIEE